MIMATRNFEHYFIISTMTMTRTRTTTIATMAWYGWRCTNVTLSATVGGCLTMSEWMAEE